MTSGPLPTGPFTCEVELRRIRAPQFVREDKQGVIVIRDASGRPARMSGYVQGLVEINSADGHPIFRGHYYDSRTLQSLTGDEALTPTGQTVVDHFENGFGEGPYAGHAFSMGARLIREGDGLRQGEGRGQID